jgi:hypothetical protein
MSLFDDFFSIRKSRLSLPVRNYGLSVSYDPQQIIINDEAEQDWTHKLELELGHDNIRISMHVEIIDGHDSAFEHLKELKILPDVGASADKIRGSLFYLAGAELHVVLYATSSEIQSLMLVLNTNKLSWMELVNAGPFTEPEDLKKPTVYGVKGFSILNALSKEI